jgi:hypothetical protein
MIIQFKGRANRKKNADCEVSAFTYPQGSPQDTFYFKTFHLETYSLRFIPYGWLQPDAQSRLL